MSLIIAGSLLVDLKAMSMNSPVARALMDPAQTTVETGNHLAYRRADNTLSWCPSGRTQEYNDEGRWSRAGRQEGRPARSVKKFLTKDAIARLEEKNFAEFAEMLRGAAEREDGEFSLVTGDEIAYWYHHSRSARDQGSLSSSCMRYGNCRPFFSIYTHNPDQVAMLIQRNEEDLLVGRALVWQTRQGVYMDRVYGQNHTIRAFERYAEDQGWMHRRTSGWGSELDVVMPDGDIRTMALEVELAEWQFQTYPYCDTMKYLDRRTGKLANYHHATANAMISATGGGWGRINGPYPGYTEPDNASFGVMSDTVRCQSCAQWAPRTEATAHGGFSFCAECAGNLSQPCGHCAQPIWDSGNHHVMPVGDQSWCYTCRIQHAANCQFCNFVAPAAELTPIRYEPWRRNLMRCASCAQVQADHPGTDIMSLAYRVADVLHDSDDDDYDSNDYSDDDDY